MSYGSAKPWDRAEGGNFPGGQTAALIPIPFLQQRLQGLFLPSSWRQEVFPEPGMVNLCLIALRVFVYPVFDQPCAIPHLQHIEGRISTA